MGGLLLLVALLACGGKVEQADRDARRAECAAEPGFDAKASDRALQQIRADACRSTLYWTKCADWWDYVVTACVFENGGERRIEVTSSLLYDTDTAREKREAMCDAVRVNVSMTDRATIHDRRGKKVTTCGKPRPRR